MESDGSGKIVLVISLLSFMFFTIMSNSWSVDMEFGMPRFHSKSIENVIDSSIIERIKRPQCAKPEMCVTFISCNRPHLLEENFKKLLTHLSKKEPWLCYELNWVDQATPNRTKYSTSYDFNKRLLISKKAGYAFAFTHVFSMCQASYMLILEEDLILRDDVDFPLISHALELLKRQPSNVYGVVMRPLWYEHGDEFVKIDGNTSYKNMSAWQVRRRRYQWNNGGLIVRMDNVHKLLSRGPYKSEEQFSARARNFGYTYVLMDTSNAPFPDPGPGKRGRNRKWFFDHRAADRKNSAIRNRKGCAGESFS